MSNRELSRRDLRVLFHPCTQMHDHESLPMTPIRRGSGVWLEDFDGNRYLDAISSWWVNLFGHGFPPIAEAIARQARQLEHVILAGFTHEPAVELAERLCALAPDGLERVFYADNGSSAIEVALKMSHHCWSNRGKPEKRLFVSLANSYHGETLGALAVGDVGLYKKTYAPLLMENIVVASPDPLETPNGEDPVAYASAALEKLLSTRSDEIAALIAEPLVQCAGGMRMYDPAYLVEARDLCDRYGVHLILDEIAVGFGRTGSLFACEQAGVSADFMCLSKGITGGFLPLAAVLLREDIYQSFYEPYERGRSFLHSHSYTGNALACAAALAVLGQFENEGALDMVDERSRWLHEGLARFVDLPHVGDVRQHGMIAAIELMRDGTTPFPPAERRGLHVYRHGLDNEVLLRPLGNVVYFMPPYVVTRDEMDRMLDVAVDGIDRAVTAKA